MNETQRSRALEATARRPIPRYRQFMVSGRRPARSTRYFVGIVALLALSGGLASVALARVAGPDRTPPSFAGLESATTCVPGPVAGQSTSYVLRWSPGTDDVTPSSKIAYDVYQATTSGGEDFSTATYVTRRGATTFTTPPLPADELVYFVVRARDRAGNREANKVERQGVNLCV